MNRDHIHNHFVWGAFDVETHKKYHSNRRTYHDIRDASDRPSTPPFPNQPITMIFSGEWNRIVMKSKSGKRRI